MRHPAYMVSAKEHAESARSAVKSVQSWFDRAAKRQQEGDCSGALGDYSQGVSELGQAVAHIASSLGARSRQEDLTAEWVRLRNYQSLLKRRFQDRCFRQALDDGD